MEEGKEGQKRRGKILSESIISKIRPIKDICYKPIMPPQKYLIYVKYK
jgi:hypothetical protein